MSEHHTDDQPRPAAIKGCGCGAAAAAALAGTMVSDPVCGMAVNPTTAVHRHEYLGATYHFCCGGCRAKFAADPAQYLALAAAPAANP